MSQDWFASWFDTPYYHFLYEHRDETEAQFFIDSLFSRLALKPNQRVLDLACGRGRHAIYMNKKGFDVTGFDLSEENIAYAKQYGNKRLHFAVRDMRNELGQSEFDWVFNLFTSFGYFDNEGDDLRAMQAIAGTLKPAGKLVIDFMNVHRVAAKLVPQEIKEAQGITFKINRSIEGDQIVKNIAFNADGRKWHFQERVKKYTVEDFNALFKAAGLRPIDYFGSLTLEPFNPQESDRLIMIVEKKA